MALMMTCHIIRIQFFFLLLGFLCFHATASVQGADIAQQHRGNIIDTVKAESIYIPEDCSRKVKDGDKVSIHYVGKLFDTKTGKSGKIFDSSRSNGKPLKFTMGSNGFIKGLSLGMAGMCVKEKRSIIIPPNLGYGSKGANGVPGGATMQFDVELIEIDDPSIKKRPPNIFREMDTDNDGRISYEEMAYWFANSHPQRLDTIPTGVWEKDDRNMDGFISWEEFSGPKGLRSQREL